MKASIFDLLVLAHLSTGRRVSLYSQWQPMLTARGLTGIELYLRRARAHDLDTKELESLWAAQSSTGVYDAITHALDDTIDQILTGMEEMATGQMRGLAEHEPVYQAGKRFLTEVFPAGLKEVTQLPYVEEVVVVENIVTKLGTSLVGVVNMLGMANMAARLAGVAPKYRQAVDAGHGRVLYKRVREANRRGLVYVAELLFMFLGVFHDSDDPAHLAAREEFLAPLMEQDERARADWRARRRGQPELEAGAGEEPDADADIEPGPGDDELGQDSDLDAAVPAELVDSGELMRDDL